MNFNWNSKTIKWYQDANKHSGFFKKIADLITPGLAGCSTFCDMGCGLGLVDLELSKKIEQITCVDINKEAIRELEKNIKQQKIKNIQTRLISCDNIHDNWDVIYLSFFSSNQIEKFLPSCQKLFAIVDKKNENKPYLEKYRAFHRNTYDKVEQQLNEKKIPYSVTEVSLEFGQPLVSVEDARNYIQTNYADVSDTDLNQFLAHHLIKTKNKDYPYYIKKNKAIGIFEVKGERQ
ncbi:methyltransferase domain-containing protein [Acetobacterium woodii]|uniref:Methyltransferase domain containing protein n=1 Tax=Acetobacterium woodii (strain ATCC 29683 / DSM 1030 / JCM 2381 / KCTC 1655 / WB1) TaxID=931626 RepID=H6LFW3_ACEWD|nr:methyltransferase domain-containing protein [Acetobacterium woodii]AFA48251.1 methyltransferase domain containing protein [Acetobacterium woodii DSM 1030]